MNRREACKGVVGTVAGLTLGLTAGDSLAAGQANPKPDEDRFRKNKTGQIIYLFAWKCPTGDTQRLILETLNMLMLIAI